MAIANLTVRLSAQIAEFQSEFREAAKSADKFAGEFEGIATRAAAVGTFIGGIAKDIAQSMARGLAQAFSDAIRLSSEFSNAFIGLSSVARAFGTDADLAKAAAQRLSSDGLLPLRDSATGLKNLLAAGFNLDQATQLMNAFKDSAAFGRQSALSFGDAIRSATEGVKNGNSILVDNAGVTKNLSQILKEAGFSAQDLSRATSDAGVRMALFNGILKETRAQTGDAERLTQTYSGQVSKLSTSYDNLLANLGMAITQNATVAKAIGLVSDLVFRLTQHLSNNRNAFNLVSDAVMIFVRALSTTVQIVDVVQRSFHAFIIIVNSVVSDFVVVARAIFKVVEQFENLQKYLDPVNFKRHAAAAAEAGQAYAFLDRVAGTLAKSTQAAMDQGIAWGQTLQGLKGTLDGVAKELEATRGKTVELGVSALTTGVALDTGLDGGSKKAAEALKKLQKVMDDTTSSLKNGLQTMVGQKVDLSTLFDFYLPPELGVRIIDGFFGSLSTLPGRKVDLSNFIPAETIVNPFREAFTNFGQELPNIIFGALQSGHSVVGAVAAGLASEFTRVFSERVAEAAKNGTQLSGSSKAIGLAGLGLSSFIGGFGAGEELGKGKGALAGAASGALAGAAFGPWGAAIGGIVGALGGLFGGAKKAKEALADLREAQSAVIQEFGGMAALKAKADEFGISLGNALTTKNASEFTRVMEVLGKAIDDQKTRIEGFGIAVEGINAKAALFAAPFEALLQNKDIDGFTAKLAEMGQRGQAEFERIGTFAAAAFAGIVKESGDAIGAINALAPTLTILQKGLNEFGLTSTGTIDSLLGMFSFINDKVTGPIFASIQATGQIFDGLTKGGLVTKDIFQTVASDIGASFGELARKGGDVSKAMALSQPILQKLWEGQQIYGEITEETTRHLLKQAEEQGIVGAHMKDVNSKILDVLIQIRDIFGKDLPKAFSATAGAAQDAARDIERGLNGIRISPIKVPIEYEDPGFTGGRAVPALAGGGIVRRRTLALVGEAGPEAVIPLNQLGSFAPASGGTTIIFEQDGRKSAEFIVPHIPGVIRRYGLV